MKLYSNVCEVNTCVRYQKVALPFLVSELLPFDYYYFFFFFHGILMHAIIR